MKKAHSFLRNQSAGVYGIVLAVIAAFSFIACDNGLVSGGTPNTSAGSEPSPIPVLAAPDIANVLSNYDIGSGEETLVQTPAEARKIIFPIIKLLGDRHDEMDDGIIDKIEDEVEWKIKTGKETHYPFSYNAAEFPLSAKLTGYGISGVKGSVEGSADVTRGNANKARSGVFAFSGIDLEYSYDSDKDFHYRKPAGTFVKGQIRASGSAAEQWNNTNDSESEEEAMAITFAIAFNDGVNRGKIAAELGYSYKETEVNDRDGYEYGPLLKAKFTFYDNDGNNKGVFEVTDPADLKRLFKFWDID